MKLTLLTSPQVYVIGLAVFLFYTYITIYRQKLSSYIEFSEVFFTQNKRTFNIFHNKIYKFKKHSGQYVSFFIRLSIYANHNIDLRLHE